MKRRSFITVLVTIGLLVVAGAVLVSAQIGDDNLQFSTSWTFQNLGAGDAHLDVDFYATDGTLAVTDHVTVSNAASYWAPDYPPLNLGTPFITFSGGILAISDQPVSSIANQVSINTISEKMGNATYMGIAGDKVAPTVYIPVLMKSFGGKYWTELNIQNTSASNIQVRVHYYNQDGSEVSGSPLTYPVYAGSPTRVAQADASILPEDWNGSAMVEAVDGTTPIAVVVNEFVGQGTRMYDEFYSYEGFVSGATRIVLPAVFVNGYGVDYQASTSVQNLSGPGSPATVTWYFYDTTPGNPNAATEILTFTERITTSKSVYFPVAPYVQTLLDGYEAGDGAWVGAVIMESDEPLVAIVNELNLPYHAASYVGLSQGDTELYFPLAFVGAYGFANTSFSIADMSGDVSTPVTVTVEYLADTEQCPGCSNTEDVYSFYNIDSKYQPEHLNEELLRAALSNGTFVGSIKITANKPINGIMNELMGDFNADNFTSFNAFPAP